MQKRAALVAVAQPVEAAVPRVITAFLSRYWVDGPFTAHQFCQKVSR